MYMGCMSVCAGDIEADVHVYGVVKCVAVILSQA